MMSEIDIETYLSQAENEAKYARTSYKEGYTDTCLLLMVRAIEKLLMVQCTTRNVPFPRNQRTVSCLLEVLKHTELYTDERMEVFKKLDEYQEMSESDLKEMISESEDFSVMENVAEKEEQEWDQKQSMNGGGPKEIDDGEEDLEEVDELFPLALRHFEDLKEALEE